MQDPCAAPSLTPFGGRVTIDRNTPQTTLVERVAKAIYDATHAGLRNCYSWDDEWEDHQEAQRSRYYKEARAAIAATEIEHLQSQLNAATEALDKFGTHKRGCNVARALPFEIRSGAVTCTCGFDTALKTVGSMG